MTGTTLIDARALFPNRSELLSGFCRGECSPLGIPVAQAIAHSILRSSVPFPCLDHSFLTAPKVSPVRKRQG